jgi:hypothetical protein
MSIIKRALAPQYQQTQIDLLLAKVDLLESKNKQLEQNNKTLRDQNKHLAKSLENLQCEISYLQRSYYHATNYITGYIKRIVGGFIPKLQSIQE